MKRNLTGRVIPAALALALAAAPVTSFAKTKAVEATGIADENGFVSQPGNEYDDGECIANCGSPTSTVFKET